MNRYYARVETEVGECTIIVKHDKVRNIDDARKRLIVHKDFKFSPEQILSVSERHKLTFDDYDPNKIDFLSDIFDGIIKYRNVGVNVG